MSEHNEDRLAGALERIAAALEKLAAPELMHVSAAEPGAYRCTHCEHRVVTRSDHAEDCPSRNPHPAELMPAPKGYKCPACKHSTAGHREHGCDRDGCDCPAPFGRIMPGN